MSAFRRRLPWLAAFAVMLVLLAPVGRFDVDRLGELNPEGLAIDACAALPADQLQERLATDQRMEGTLHQVQLSDSNADSIMPFSYRSECDYEGRSHCVDSADFPPISQVTVIVNGMTDPESARQRFQVISAGIFTTDPAISHRTRLAESDTGHPGALSWVAAGNKVSYSFHEGHFTGALSVTFCELDDPVAVQKLVVERLGTFDEPLDDHVAPSEEIFG